MMIEEADAIELAKQIVIREGWLWQEPINITPRYDNGKIKNWEIKTNILLRGGNARIIIDGDTGDIVHKGYLPR